MLRQSAEFSSQQQVVHACPNERLKPSELCLGIGEAPFVLTIDAHVLMQLVDVVGEG